MVVQVDDMANVTALTKMINDMGYNANSSVEWIQQQIDSMNMIQAVLGAIGAVAMLVAAISITNTMMMSIYERTPQSPNSPSIIPHASMRYFLGCLTGVLLSPEPPPCEPQYASVSKNTGRACDDGYSHSRGQPAGGG